MVYSDPFNGFLDYTVSEGGNERYAEMAEKLREIAKKSRKYGYIFETEACLCDVLAIKYDLGVRTRAAYQAGDKQALRTLAEQDYAAVLRGIKVFYRAFEKQWLLENSPTGFDVQDIRIGGLLQRLSSCRRRLLAYAAGEISVIEELENKLVALEENYKPAHNYRHMASPNVL
jgi:hypothetical protein